MKAIVRPPSPRLAEGLLTHLERQSVSADLSVAQWHGYVDALAAHGWEPVVLPALDDCPDGVFVEDTLVVRDDLAVITRPMHPSRQAEVATAQAAVEKLGYRLAHIEGPGFLEGGDVLTVGSRTYVGLTLRTNQAGVAQLAAALGGDVVGVPTNRVLHLKSAVTALPDGRVIGFEPLVDDPTAFEGFTPVPEEPGSHVVLLDDRHLLMAASAPRSAELFASWGYEPVVVDISEFEKLEGCVTCLSVRLRTPPLARGVEIPG